jgi:hypothetical protein
MYSNCSSPEELRLSRLEERVVGRRNRGFVPPCPDLHLCSFSCRELNQHTALQLSMMSMLSLRGEILKRV